MRIPNQRKNCLWCERRLVSESFQPPDDVNFGPVPRSKEHIIPESVFGRIVTYDLCRLCNASFGSVCDFALLDDGRFVEAAAKAGFRFEDIRSNFTITRESSTGRKVETRFKGGSYRHRVQKFEDGMLGIPMTDGKIADRDFENAVQMLTSKVLARNRPGLTDRNTIAALVRKFLERVRKAPERVHFDLTLGESFRLTELPPKGKVEWQFHPWETDWSLAKCIFEFSWLLWPNDYLQYCAPALNEIRDFLRKQDHNPVAGTGAGLFVFTQSDAAPIKQHTATCLMRTDHLLWELTFFGTASWKFERVCKPGPSGYSPACSYDIRIKNPFGGAVPDASVELNAL